MEEHNSKYHKHAQSSIILDMIYIYIYIHVYLHVHMKQIINTHYGMPKPGNSG